MMHSYCLMLEIHVASKLSLHVFSNPELGFVKLEGKTSTS